MSGQPFIKRIWNKPPILFPLVALFLIIWTIISIWTYRTEPFPSIGWIQPLWMLLFAVSWLFICDLKRWAAMMFVALTTINLFLRFFIKDPDQLDIYTHAIFPIDILLSFFVLFFFKKFG